MSDGDWLLQAAVSRISLKGLQNALDSYNDTLTHAQKNDWESLTAVYRERAGSYRRSRQDELAGEDENRAGGTEK